MFSIPEEEGVGSWDKGRRLSGECGVQSKRGYMGRVYCAVGTSTLLRIPPWNCAYRSPRLETARSRLNAKKSLTLVGDANQQMWKYEVPQEWELVVVLLLLLLLQADSAEGPPD